MLAVPPWVLTAAVDADALQSDAFALDASGKRYRLVLVRTRFSEGAEAACEFLIQTPEGSARCGLGEGRPRPCRSFPAQLIDGEVRFSNEGCSCDWSGVQSDDEADTDLLQAEVRARAAYAGVVLTWNAYVASLDPSVALTHRDFCRYLMDAYGT